MEGSTNYLREIRFVSCSPLSDVNRKSRKERERLQQIPVESVGECFFSSFFFGTAAASDRFSRRCTPIFERRFQFCGYGSDTGGHGGQLGRPGAVIRTRFPSNDVSQFLLILVRNTYAYAVTTSLLEDS